MLVAIEFREFLQLFICVNSPFLLQLILWMAAETKVVSKSFVVEPIDKFASRVSVRFRWKFAAVAAKSKTWKWPFRKFFLESSFFISTWSQPSFQIDSSSRGETFLLCFSFQFFYLFLSIYFFLPLSLFIPLSLRFFLWPTLIRCDNMRCCIRISNSDTAVVINTQNIRPDNHNQRSVWSSLQWVINFRLTDSFVWVDNSINCPYFGKIIFFSFGKRISLFKNWCFGIRGNTRTGGICIWNSRFSLFRVKRRSCYMLHVHVTWFKIVDILSIVVNVPIENGLKCKFWKAVWRISFVAIIMK